MRSFDAFCTRCVRVRVLLHVHVLSFHVHALIKRAFVVMTHIGPSGQVLGAAVPSVQFIKADSEGSLRGETSPISTYPSTRKHSRTQTKFRVEEVEILRQEWVHNSKIIDPTATATIT